MTDFQRRAWAWYQPELREFLAVLRGERRYALAHSDARRAFHVLPDCSLDSFVTDPPSGISFMGRDWDRDKGGRDQWIAWLSRIMVEMLRVLKPGGHGLVWSLPRTSHWTAMALDDAGLEIRDSILHVFGSGFPKSVNLGEGRGTALKPAVEIWWLVRKPLDGTLAQNIERWGTGGLRIDDSRVAHASATDRAEHEAQVAAIKARGGSMDNSWKNSSDLAGANEVNDAGRWPANIVFSHHPDCVCLGKRAVPANPTWDTPNRNTQPSTFTGDKVSKVRHARAGEPSAERRYTERGATNFAALPGERRDDVEEVEHWQCVDGCPVKALGEQSGELTSGFMAAGTLRATRTGYSGHLPHLTKQDTIADSGTAARYFQQFQPDDEDFAHLLPFMYQAKPSSSERDDGLAHLETLSGGKATRRKDGTAGVNNPRAGAGRTGGRRNAHPTVKSKELMRYFVRLVTPKGGRCGDPFTGSGTTGVACIEEGLYFIGSELMNTEDEPFVNIARARIANALGFDEHASPILAEDPRTGLKQLSLFALGRST